jgi:enoyl-CoA hydratase
MDFETILYQFDGGVARLTFNRPKALNALNGQLLSEFQQALEMASGDPEVRVLILTGSGEKAFVAGADITEIAQMNALQAKFFARRGQETITQLEQLAIPVIAAVNGFALGGGSEMAIACDFIYASENAMFGLPEISLGIIPGFGGTQRLPRVVGAPRAKELIYTGKMIPAQEAAQMGWVNKVCKPEDLLAEVVKTAQLIASKGRVALRAAKEVINLGGNVDLRSGLAAERDAFALCLTSPDAEEGTRAFLEKRAATFSGTLDGE